MRATARVWLTIAAFPALLAAALSLSCGGGSDTPDFTDRLVLVRAEGITELDLATGDEPVLIPQPPEAYLADPAVSPDRTRLAYTVTLVPPVIPGQVADFGTDLYESRIDGAGAQLVLEHGAANDHIRWPSWFPDGQQLLISTQRLAGSVFELVIERFNEVSGARTAVVRDAFRPEISPDGSRIAYVTQDANFAEDLWVANADGSDARQIAGTVDGFGSFEVPRFSPDGSTLVFGASEVVSVERSAGPRYVSSRGAYAKTSSAANGLPMDIWTADLAGGGEPELLADLKLDSPSLSWSGDGQRLFILSGGGLYAIVLADRSTYRIGEGTYHGQVAWLAAE